uniref:Putative secreted protein n=1 Tax=Anopheles marajoara TaxID=58244 RepID=A0A2M4CFK3_9DIPT
MVEMVMLYFCLLLWAIYSKPFKQTSPGKRGAVRNHLGKVPIRLHFRLLAIDQSILKYNSFTRLFLK